MKNKDIENYLDNVFNYKGFNEKYSTNGLQVAGAENIRKVAFAVDATSTTIQKAIDQKANALIVHHGLFWPSIKSIKGPNLNAFKLLLKNDVSLFGMHLPLDVHPKLGHNVVIIGLLGAKIVEKHNYSFVGEFREPKSLEDIKNKLNIMLDTESKLFEFRSKAIKRFAVCSGAGASEIYSLEQRGDIELLITGELKHSIYDFAKESNIALIGAGHYATETVGIKMLREKFEKDNVEKFNIETIYIDEKIDL